MPIITSLAPSSMGKIHPAAVAKLEGEGPATGRGGGPPSTVWTVWKKSSMAFQGTDGFSVYDGEGRLAYRVDNYSRKHKEILLMDGSGRALLDLRPQVLSMHDHWNGFKSEDDDNYSNIWKTRSKSKIFTMRRRHSILRSSNDVEVFMSGTSSARSVPDFRIVGQFWRRTCEIRSRSGHVVARISPKVVSKSVVLSDDVFNLAVRPGTDSTLIMAFVVIMDRIFEKPNVPLIMCS